MVYNVHQLKHLTECVRLNGPLFAYSNYCMEDHIGHMVSLVKGTTDVTSQITAKYILEKELTDFLKKCPRAQIFYDQIERKLTFPISKKVDGTLIIGKPLKNQFKNMTENQVQFVKKVLKIEESEEIFEYNSIHLGCKIFYEIISNSAAKRTNDSFIFNVKTNRFADIQAIFMKSGNLFLLIAEKYDAMNDQFCEKVTFLKELEKFELKVIKPNEIGQKNVLIKFQNVLACSTFPNLYEKN